MPTSFTPDSETSRFRWLTRIVLRLGLTRSLLALTGIVTVLAVAISQAVISVVGHGDRVIATASATLCSLLLTPLVGSFVLRLVFELDRARQQLMVLATQDDLTGVHNRRHFMAVVQREWDRARRYSTQAAMLLIDADHFKRVNDTFGHTAGDTALRALAGHLKNSVRAEDMIARFGGEEFAVLAREISPEGALVVAERIRRSVELTPVTLGDGRSVPLTVSIGVVTMGTKRSFANADALLEAADEALYRAKEAGRNRCEGV